jgi:predicted acetyltransferase
MPSENSLPHGVEVIPAAREQEPVLANLLELYAYDFSEFTDLAIGPDGRFKYPKLLLYWQEENRFPFLVKVDGQLAGLVLVLRGSLISGDPQVWDMAEFFVMRRYRRRRIGAALAREVWRCFPGAWEVRVLESNTTALAFWKASISAFTGSWTESVSVEDGGKRRRVFSFVSSGADGV